MADKKFVGKIFDAKFAIAKLNLSKQDINEIVSYMKETGKDSVGILIKESQKGTKYAEIDTWQPQPQGAPQTVKSVKEIQQKHNPQTMTEPLSDDLLPF